MSIAIIDVNDVFFNLDAISKSQFTEDTITDLISDHIEIKNLNNSQDELMQLLIQELITDNEFAIHTSQVSYINNELYQLCHVYLTKDTYETIKNKNIKYNGVASYLSDTNLRVFGKAILLKYNDTNLENLTISDVVNLFIKKFVHKGIIVNENDSSINEFKFIYNPIDWVTVEEHYKYKYYELEVYDKILMIFFDETIKTNKNNIISILINKNIYGTAILALRNHYQDMNDTNIIYNDLDEDTYKKLINIVNNKQNNTPINAEINNSEQSVSSNTNFHKMLNKQNNKYVIS